MTTDETLDPVFRHSRREALVILALWTASFLWTVPFSYFQGYHKPGDPLDVSLTFGMPSWVFWGVALPWLVTGLVSMLLCLFFIRDDDLGHADDEVVH